MSQVDGQTKYVKSLIRTLSKKYEIEIPSEKFFEFNKEKFNSWILRTLLVNLYLIKWIIKNRNNLKNRHLICIIEDRYTILPSYLAVKLVDIELISRVSDWGDSYISSLKFDNIFSSYLMHLINSVYEKFVVKYSKSIIVPSDLVYKQINNICSKRIFYYPQPYEPYSNFDSHNQTDINFTDNDHDIYCVLVANYHYKPNEEAGNFIVNELATKVIRTDPMIKFLLIGEGSIEKYSKYESSNVSVLGLVPDLTKVYAKCKIGINPSLTKGGTSIKNIEYLVNGLYVVTTPEASIGVIKSTNVYIFDRRDFSQIICELGRKIRNGHITQNEKEIERIREHYSESKISENLIKFLLGS